MDIVEKRVEWAEALISMGEISAARHALEGSPVAPGNEDTLNALRDEDRRPPVPRDPILEEIVRTVPARPFELDKDKFLHCLRTARRGAAGGPAAQSFAQASRADDSAAKAEWRSAGNCCW